ncbi:uncharacterized protein F4807DRAFT_429778 [Annulohypoxylon truncatum]|uniref:uncharacterized protein n=1 Tax=Annulohypoxylon truncatum TaxID=327061 RepID=UPI002007A6A3|nr:uncharacterized protein F4807DRAFT_429778 [Annulohypoxylon truncatum]KAI1208864.1 hypothetical protein F4807DRAFT_429778 [Annulohypoxylon truncatum]
MGHPFHPDDFPLNTDVVLQPTRAFYLKGCIHFKATAQIIDLSGRLQSPFVGDFSHAFLDEAEQVARKLSSSSSPTYEIKSSGNMMRTLKTIADGSSGERVCDLNITFVSFGSSTVRFPKDSPHSRHEVELCPVGGRAAGGDESKHEAFVKNSIPYFWDMTRGRVGILYKCLNQKRVEIGRVAGYGFDKDAVLVLNGNELDDVVAIATCIILLNGRDAMDA